MDTTLKATVLDYWRSIELFSPQSVPRVSAHDLIDPVFLGLPDTPLPWDDSHPLKTRKRPFGTSRRFTVYCGIFQLEATRLVLENTFGKDPEVFDERSDGESCFFAFSVTDDGRPLFDTFVLSTCAWATARATNPGPSRSDWLQGFEAAANKIGQDFAQRYAIGIGDERGRELESKGFALGRPITYSDLLEATTHVIVQLGAQGLIQKLEIRVKAGLVASRTKYSAKDQDFLNSFFVRDLGYVADQVRRKNIGRGLEQFLTAEIDLDLNRRTDVRASIDTLFEQLSPALFPAGKWPSQNQHPLVFSQQFAINSALQGLKNSSGLFAINGPPGTGKTTLLRDLVAAVVVERAQRLMALTQPSQAFDGEVRWKTGKFTRVISKWKPEFQGFELVVASSNNGAVENVSLEMPSLDAIDANWLGQTDYFPEMASRLIDRPAWAMIAARLGNKQNRSQFVNQFWYESKPDGDSEDATSDSAASGFSKHLRDLEKQKIDWPRAVQKFKSALANEKKLRESNEETHRNLLGLLGLAKEIPQLEAIISNLNNVRAFLLGQCDAAKTLEVQAAQIMRESQQKRLEHAKRRPSLLNVVLSWGKSLQEWQRSEKAIQVVVNAQTQAWNETQQQFLTHQIELESLERKVSQTNSSLAQKREQLSRVHSQITEAKTRLGSFFPTIANWQHDQITRELSSPWATPEWNAARTQVFLEALELHKAFIAANADTMRKSLHGAMDVLAGNIPDSVSPQGVRAAWTALFFVIPVISTTFASFERLFAHFGREAIGWLLIDEAGQAIPQAAAGAIWRAKRSVVIGDPLQLEPVVTIPFTVQQALRNHHKVADTWLPGSTSVQQLADRVSRFGTRVRTQDDSVWVGSPLRVHRRCDQPMFNISNEIAYDGLMVFGTSPKKLLDLPVSQWIDVNGANCEGHWIPEEGQVLEELIQKLISDDLMPENIFLISPFRVVVRQLRRIAKGYPGMKAGTVHTVQGKEAEVVILVLGGDVRRPGAKKWASSRPNLLNVAVTRAKRRLFVIGNKSLWHLYQYFSECVSSLDQHQTNAK